MLEAGMTLAIETMINQGTWKVRILKDKWTAVTADGRLSAHYEHTIAITENEPLILSEL
jgi:methionyl aminopeptidase